MTKRRRLVSVAALVLLGGSTHADPEVDIELPIRSIDGSGNNLAAPQLGAASTLFARAAPVDYGDGLSAPAGAHRPSARAISNIVCAQPGDRPSATGASAMVFQWAQFLDHDLDLTDPASPPEPLPIEVPGDDAVFAPGTQLPFARSDWLGGAATPREQRNSITTWIDASMVYGSDPVRAAALRTLDGTGRLRTSRWVLLPFNDAGLPNAGGPDPSLFLAGDVRANEQIGLTALHVVFVREHNRIADELRRAEPELDGDAIYERARAIVGAEIQVITYEEFLPMVLGPGALPTYAGYDPSVDASIVNEFATVAFRFGHSMVFPIFPRLKRNGTSIPDGPLPLSGAFFAPHELDPDAGKNVEPLLRGLANTRAQEVDVFVVDGLRNFLFGGPGAGGLDLPALNIQRARDHGIPGYNGLRVALGLAPAASFAEVSSDPVVQARLAAAYPTVDDIDPWVGGLAEDHVPGALVGELFFTILRDQFIRLRDGDRFWYQNVFPPDEAAALATTRLADIIVRNTSVKDDELGATPFSAP